MSDHRHAIVLGANGQDGSFLVKHLLAKGYLVTGVGSQSHGSRPEEGGYRYRRCDLRDQSSFEMLLAELDADCLFHFAAIHGSAAGNQYEAIFGDMLKVNVESLHTVLEHARRREGLRIIYAGSSKCFGASLPPTIDASTPRKSDCLYSVTKNAAADLVNYYRATHGVAAGVVFLFNHESELRPSEFFIPKLARALKNARLGVAGRVPFFTLDFYCDWGSADEYMSLVVGMVERAAGTDFVLGTGRCVLARDLAARLFAEEGAAVEDFIDSPEGEPKNRPYRVDVGKLTKLVGRAPRKPIEHVIKAMAQVQTEPAP